MIAEVRRAIALNEARESATADALTGLAPGDVPEGWPSFDLTADVIRSPLLRAEALLNEQVNVIGETDGVIRLEIPGEVAAGLNEFDREALHDDRAHAAPAQRIVELRRYRRLGPAREGR